MYTPQFYCLILLSHWITDTRKDCIIVLIVYALIFILWSIYGKLFFNKSYDSVAVVLVCLLTFLLHILVMSKILYLFSFWIFMTYYLILILSLKDQKKFFFKSIFIYILLITLITFIEVNIDMDEKIKPIIIAKEYMNVNHENNVDYYYSIENDIFDLNEPLYIMVWKNFDTDDKELIKLFYYKNQIFEKTEGTIIEFRELLLNDDKDN